MTLKPRALMLRTGQALGWAGIALLIWLVGRLAVASLWGLAVVAVTPLVLVAIATTLDYRRSTLRRVLLWVGITLWLYSLLTLFRFLFPPILAWTLLTRTSLCLLLLASSAALRNQANLKKSH